jgi:hypothetical protein
VILGVFGFGFDNISHAVADYYKFDKITNIERVYPEFVTFPAIIICTSEGYRREHYRNGSLIKADRVFTNLINEFLNFDSTWFRLYKNSNFLNRNYYLDSFKINHLVYTSSLDCLRFNAATNRSIELFKATSVLDRFRISIKNFYVEKISNVEYYNITFSNDTFFVYIGDNSLNSLENLKYLELQNDSAHRIEIEKESIETKLPEPYNP